jgi:chemotaxis protein methyltransferase CheR
VRRKLHEQAGISLNHGKRDLAYGRLSRRLRALGFTDFAAYLCYLDSPGGESELVHFINALTINLTAFFREPHHFDFLSATVLPEAVRRHNHDRRIRLWSAGCSTGEEPYSIAITVQENLAGLHDWDFSILATDLDSSVVETARRGQYGLQRVEGLATGRASKWFQPVGARSAQRVQVSRSLKDMISFQQLNLMRQWPTKDSFDLIFCRNVIIYFDKATRRSLFSRFADSLVEGGYLFIGRAEDMLRSSDRFERVGQAIYRKTEG